MLKINIFYTIKNRNTVRKIILCLLKFIGFFNAFIPKKANKILFYDSLNDTLTDNSLAVLLYLQEEKLDKKYKIICCVPNSKRKYINDIKNIGIIKGILNYLTSKYVFYSFGGMRIKPSSKQFVINLWHGTPLKNIGKLNISDNKLKNENNNDFKYILVSSEYFKKIYLKAFSCTNNQILINGNPRNDFLFKKGNVIGKLGINKAKYKKVILWMPTFRISKDKRFKDISNDNETGLPLLDTIDKINEFNKFLESKNILIILKIHNYSILPKVKCNNILIITNDLLNSKRIFLYEFIKEFDVLLTDYSSVYFDYLLLNKPIGFIIDDFEDYKQNRGFSINDPLRLMPGVHIKTEEDFKSFLINISNGIDDFEEVRKNVNKLVNTYKNNNTKYLLKKIGIR